MTHAQELNFINMLGTVRHLYLPDTVRCSYSALNALSDLETLENVHVAGFGSNDFLRWTKLRKLSAKITMMKENQLEPFMDYLNNNSLMLRRSSLHITLELSSATVDFIHVLRKLLTCRNLQTLILVHGEQELPLGGIYKLPEYQNTFFSTSLTEMFLVGFKLKEDSMETLEKLPNLQTLVFSHEAYTGKKMVCSSAGFPQLRRLCLHDMLDLEDWLMEKGTLGMLVSLRIEYCRKMKMLPEGLKFLTNLKELHIYSMPVAFKKAVKAEDSYKIQHVPVVEIL